MSTPDASTVIISSIGSGGLVSLVIYLLGRGRERHKDEVAEEAQDIVNAVALKTAEQKTIEQLMSRVTALEAWQERAAVKMEALSSDKYRLEAEAIAYQREIADLKAVIARLTQDGDMARINIADLELRLAAATARAGNVEAQLKTTNEMLAATQAENARLQSVATP